MSISAQDTRCPAAVAFDSIATDYDQLFTASAIGRVQRSPVWSALAATFRRGDRVLELNCGTGEDAFFLARLGVSVVACDVSAQMIRIARQRQAIEDRHMSIHFEQLASENLRQLPLSSEFDGVFSNFSGLNCVDDLRPVAQQLATLLPPGAPALFCMSTRVCAWETLWYVAHREWKRAFRRWPGRAEASVNGHSVLIHYPRVREIGRMFSPWLALRGYKGVGIVVPPSYAEAWAKKHPRLLAMAARLDQSIADAPVLRVLGDHMLFRLERTNA